MTRHATEALNRMLTEEEELLIDLQNRVESNKATLETSELRVGEKLEQVAQIKEALEKIEG